MTTTSILWRRLDQPGHESARLTVRDGGATLAGTAVFAHEGKACRLDYVVACDGAWRTVSARVTGWVGAEPVEIDLSVDAGRRWRLDGRECREVEGCLDVDLNFSPSTNLLAIRRLGDAAYRYESGGGRFVRDLDVDAAGFVIRYPDFFVAE